VNFGTRAQMSAAMTDTANDLPVPQRYWAILTIARVVQGFGAAGIMSVNTALIRFTKMLTP
jgi:MFS family permease